MDQKTNEYRKAVADAFIKSLQENELQWKKGWHTAATVPQNAITGKTYKGLNRFFLTLQSMANNITDPRWATFKQIQDKGWHLNKGAKGMKVEYWTPYDYQNKKSLEWTEYNKLLDDPERRGQIGVVAKYYHVFNAQDITGIPELPEPERHPEAVSDEIIDKISQNMGVEITNEGGDRAYYSIREDKIFLPQKIAFASDYEYNSTALHELSHATGAEKRLNRDIKNRFGTEKYAYEELVAEISACFMGEHLTMQLPLEHMENHKAYVQSWIEQISEKPAVLMKAIRDAESSANYLEYQAELISDKEYQKTLAGTRETEPGEIVPKEVMAEHMTGKEIAAAKLAPDLPKEPSAKEPATKQSESKIITQEIYEKIMDGGQNSFQQDFRNCVFKNVKFNWFRPQMPYTQQPIVDIVAFHGADFTGSSFMDCDFSSVQFRDSNFQNCRISDCVFNRNHIDHCNFSNAQINGTRMNKVDIMDSNLFKVSLSYTDILNSQLTGNNFFGVKADGVEFKTCFAIRNRHVDKIGYAFLSEKQRVEEALGASDREAVSSVSDARQKELNDCFNDRAQWKSLTEQERQLVESWESRWNNYLGGIAESEKQQYAIADDIRVAGFRPTNGMVDHMTQLEQAAGRTYTLKEVCDLCKKPRNLRLGDSQNKPISNSDERLFNKALDGIVQECKGQELARMAAAQAVPVV